MADTEEENLQSQVSVKHGGQCVPSTECGLCLLGEAGCMDKSCTQIMESCSKVVCMDKMQDKVVFTRCSFYHYLTPILVIVAITVAHNGDHREDFIFLYFHTKMHATSVLPSG